MVWRRGHVVFTRELTVCHLPARYTTSIIDATALVWLSSTKNRTSADWEGEGP